MALGTHWEWRGFGAVSDSFLDRYGKLRYEFGPQQVRDLYIWAPSLQVNLKIREGAEGGLKFKRFMGRDGCLQRWSEDPDDLHDFPLNRTAWHSLDAELAKANLAIGSYPDEPPDRAQLRSILEKAGCKRVLVSKEREGRRWQGPHGRVLVERTVIRRPQPILSVSLESEDMGIVANGLIVEQVKADIRAVIMFLHLDHEFLTPVNYMEAVALWARGEKIDFPGS